jgi:hypothetical protein
MSVARTCEAGCISLAPALAARFNLPSGVALNAAGTLCRSCCGSWYVAASLDKADRLPGGFFVWLRLLGGQLSYPPRRGYRGRHQTDRRRDQR